MIDQLQAAVASTRSVLEGVNADQLGGQTPCASWTVGECIDHVINAQGFFLAGLTGQPPAAPGQFSDGDYIAAYDEATSAVVAAFSEPGALGRMVQMPFGEMPGAAVAGLATNDTFTHGWDIAKATGQSTDLNPELAEQVLAMARQSIQEGFRGPEGAAPFGAEQQAPEGASAADQLAAFLGRTVA